MVTGHTVTIVIVLKTDLHQECCIMETFLYLRVYYKVSSSKRYASVDVENIVRFKEHDFKNLKFPSKKLVSQTGACDIVVHENPRMNLSTSRKNEILLTQLQVFVFDMDFAGGFIIRGDLINPVSGVEGHLMKCQYILLVKMNPYSVPLTP